MTSRHGSFLSVTLFFYQTLWHFKFTKMSNKRKRGQHIVVDELEKVTETISRAKLFKIVNEVQAIIAAAKLRGNKVGMPSIPWSLY